MRLTSIRRSRFYKYKYYVFVVIIVVTIILFRKNAKTNNAVSYSAEELESMNKYELVIGEYESQIISGLGKYGKAAFLDGEAKEKGKEALKTFALNTVLSDRIPLDRPLGDYRHQE